MTKYVPNGNAKIVVDKVVYQNDGEKMADLPVEKIGKDELERLLKAKFIKKIVFEESGVSKSSSGNKTQNIDRDAKLLGKANKLGINVTDDMTDEEIQIAITEKQARFALVGKAKKLGIDTTDDMTDEEIQTLISEKEVN